MDGSSCTQLASNFWHLFPMALHIDVAIVVNGDFHLNRAQPDSVERLLFHVFIRWRRMPAAT